MSAGLIAKISTLLTAKAATVAAATTCLLTAGSVTAYEVQQQATPVRAPGPTVAAAADRAGVTKKPANAPAMARRGSQGGGAVASSGASSGLAVIHIRATATVHDQASRIAGGRVPVRGQKAWAGGVTHVHIPLAGHVHTRGHAHSEPAPPSGTGNRARQPQRVASSAPAAAGAADGSGAAAWRTGAGAAHTFGAGHGRQAGAKPAGTSGSAANELTTTRGPHEGPVWARRWRRGTVVPRRYGVRSASGDHREQRHFVVRTKRRVGSGRRAGCCGRSPAPPPRPRALLHS